MAEANEGADVSNDDAMIIVSQGDSNTPQSLHVSFSSEVIPGLNKLDFREERNGTVMFSSQCSTVGSFHGFPANVSADQNHDLTCSDISMDECDNIPARAKNVKFTLPVPGSDYSTRIPGDRDAIIHELKAYGCTDELHYTTQKLHSRLFSIKTDARKKRIYPRHPLHNRVNSITARQITAFHKYLVLNGHLKQTKSRVTARLKGRITNFFFSDGRLCEKPLLKFKKVFAEYETNQVSTW